MALHRRLDLLVTPEELAARGARWHAARATATQTRGYTKLYVEHVLQADRGCDFDFLVGGSGSEVARESH